MAKETTTSSENKTDVAHVKKTERCGIIMPISPIDGCDENHWANVLGILSDAIRDADYEPNLVSAADDIGVIQKRIVQNIYENPIVVCDVSGKNPNVMLELGMRLAFDKPVIIVKDDKTSYSFDTSPIEHLSYPRDLRYHTIVDFKENLSRKIVATVGASQNGDHTTFLGHFGEFKVAKIDTKEVTPDDLILSQLQEIRDEMRSLSKKQSTEIINSDLYANNAVSEQARAANYASSVISGKLAPGQTEISQSDIENLVGEVRAMLRRRLPTQSQQRLSKLAESSVMHSLTTAGITDIRL